MHCFSTYQSVFQTKAVAWFGKAFILLLLLFFQAGTLQAHTVDYFSSCGYVCAGSTVTVNAHLSATASNTNYNWQFRDNSNVWKCFVNGTNTINNSPFTVSNATAKGQLSAAPTLTIANATTALSNVEVRLVMADGNNVSPCASNPSYPVYGTNKILKLHILTGVECANIQTYCGGGPVKPPTEPGCVGNITSNSSGYYGGFESGGSSISTNAAGSDLYNGLPRNGSYQIVKSVDDLGGGGYLKIKPRTGNYFLAAHTSNDENDKVWYIKLNVTPGTTYNFCTYVTLLKNLGDGANYILGLYANGVSIGTGRVTFDWTQICGTYKVPAGVTTLELSIRDPKKGLFFVAIDDICITSTPPPPPPVTLTLGNQVWNDYDGDGKRDTNEPGIPGAPITLYTDNNSDNLPDGAAIKTTTSDELGRYLFTGLTAGRYIASMRILPGYQQSPNTSTQTTSPTPDNNVDDDNNLVRLDGPNGPGGIVYTNAITLTAGEEPTTDGDGANGNNTFDLAQCGNAFIGDFVWNDLNGNGIQDAGEPGINGVKVTITFSDGRTATKITETYNASNNPNDPQFDGYYNFPNLGPGTYKITFETPAGLHASPANAGDDAKDSDPVNGGPVTVTLAADQSNFTIDAGFTTHTPPPPPPPVVCPNLSVGNMVFADLNGNGIKEPSEPGIGGLTVKLYADADDNDIADGAAISTLMTADDGTYYFGNLAAGKYIIGVTTGSTYAQVSIGSANPDDDKNNDNNGVKTINGEVFSNAITLVAGNEPINDGSDNNSNLTLDFGFKLKSVPCTTHCECKNDCTHTGCGHSNCGHNTCKNDCKHNNCEHENCGHNSCKNDCKHNDCNHKDCGKKSYNSSRAASTDGQATVVSAIITPDLTNTSVSIFPNPANNYVAVKVMATKGGKGLARITDATGKLVATKTATISTGMNVIRFDRLDGLQAGTYYVQLDFNYHTYNKQLMIVK